MKQTAVEFLLDNLHYLHSTDWDDIIEQAKEMEKQQIIEAHGAKKKTKSNPDSLVTYEYWFSGEDYYSKIFE